MLRDGGPALPLRSPVLLQFHNDNGRIVIQVLACEAGRTHVSYRHRADGRAFEIDTNELQRELGDIPLTDPRVLCWLAEYVRTGIMGVGSKA